MDSANIYLGLMSGTSIDSIDVAAVEFTQNNGTPVLLGSHSHPIPETLKQQILTLCLPGSDSVQLLCETDNLLGELFAEAALTLISSLNIRTQQIAAIGSHGQTVRHSPPGADRLAYSQQIADPTIIAARTGCTVVADFRRADMALGGHGAPLVPAFHQQLFSQPEINRVILNIGGIANITVLNANGDCSGYDTGPGNILLDSWCRQQLGTAYDNNGDWGAGGTVDSALLKQLKSHSFFAQPAPKSTGREEFNLAWLENQLSEFNLPAQDIQATLMQLTADSIADQINNLGLPISEVFACGGGVMNSALMQLLADAMPQSTVSSTSELGLDPNWVEACAFAWLAKQRLELKPGNLPAVTGASRETVLGGLYLP
jgi:anhydro-N-acetylmuramic acid kinase